jgi:NAD(P)-dependent dehydrogenase (short-subunit alcohol dehydrogenase family)
MASAPTRATRAPARRLEGRVCLITGGSRNLGRALGLAFARAGARVAFTFAHSDEDAANTCALLAELGPAPLCFKGSAADPEHVASTVSSVVAAWGGLDVLVHNAGAMQIVPIALMEEADWDAVMDVNVKGAYLFARAVLRPMLRARRGHILHIGSFGSDRLLPAPVHYAAAKSALRGFSEALAKEVGRYGVRVNLLAPGLLEAGMSRRLPDYRLREYVEHCALGRLGGLDEIAAAAVWLVSDEATLLAGARVVIDGGL